MARSQRKADDEARYFWSQVRALNGRRPPSKSTDARALFGTQGAAGINFNQYDDIKVTRSGEGADSIPSLDDYNALQALLPPYLHMNLTHPQRMGYKAPTPIQKVRIALARARERGGGERRRR